MCYTDSEDVSSSSEFTTIKESEEPAALGAFTSHTRCRSIAILLLLHYFSQAE